jgi:hypothetical protein
VYFELIKMMLEREMADKADSKKCRDIKEVRKIQGYQVNSLAAKNLPKLLRSIFSWNSPPMQALALPPNLVNIHPHAPGPSFNPRGQLYLKWQGEKTNSVAVPGEIFGAGH